ncbi:MAG: hypothetical protein HUU06_04905 [Planctomycetaceae bacterium]|nr:hypothetical protein [Planctomycetota bacterium]NUN52117.1 hypothetical protein [Planctomycetaceae bacterium]
MRNATSRGGLLVGALATVGVGLWLLAPAAAAPQASPPKNRDAAPRVHGEGAPIHPASDPGGIPASPDSSAPAATLRADTMARARDLIARLRQIPDNFAVPADLRADLLSFMTASTDSRDLLFRMAWNPATPARALANLELFLRTLPDRTLGEALIAAFETFDPENAVRTEMAAKAGDTALLVADLRALPAGKDRHGRLIHLTKDACRDPAVADFLRETATDDPDAETRIVAGYLLASVDAAGTREILVAAATDPGRTLRERQSAAHSMTLLPGQAPAADLVRMYEEAPDEVRPLVVQSFPSAGPSDRIDAILLENAASVAGPRNLRNSSTGALGLRLVRLKGDAARVLGERTAEIVRNASPEASVEMLKHLGLAVVENAEVRDAVRDLSRTAPSGGAVQVAIATNPALKMAAGL